LIFKIRPKSSSTQLRLIDEVINRLSSIYELEISTSDTISITNGNNTHYVKGFLIVTSEMKSADNLHTFLSKMSLSLKNPGVTPEIDFDNGVSIRFKDEDPKHFKMFMEVTGCTYRASRPPTKIITLQTKQEPVDIAIRYGWNDGVHVGTDDKLNCFGLYKIFKGI
jgi:hypothetical protein